VVRAALWIGPRPKKHRTDPNARLFVAAETGKLSEVRRLVEHAFADVNATGIDNWTSLHFAARAGHLPVVNYLLKQGAALDAVTKSKWTALHLAVDKAKFDCAEVLLTCGADPNVRDNVRHTAHSANHTAAQPSAMYRVCTDCVPVPCVLCRCGGGGG
jgi:ankyrin repeat protein